MKRSDISTKVVIEACRDFHAGCGIPPWRLIMMRTGAPEKVVYAAMDRDERMDYIESGVSTRTGWATDKGLAYLLECKD